MRSRSCPRTRNRTCGKARCLLHSRCDFVPSMLHSPFLSPALSQIPRLMSRIPFAASVRRPTHRPKEHFRIFVKKAVPQALFQTKPDTSERDLPALYLYSTPESCGASPAQNKANDTLPICPGPSFLQNNLHPPHRQADRSLHSRKTSAQEISSSYMGFVAPCFLKALWKEFHHMKACQGSPNSSRALLVSMLTPASPSPKSCCGVLPHFS